ncbi:hypothetical protein QEP66_09415 [Streptomyces sp. LB8]|nr:hypothetical protein [Streptomyces sp. LB8]MDN5382301.1 hypothetical protein [Streptomyces sp. LB8]
MQRVPRRLRAHRRCRGPGGALTAAPGTVRHDRAQPCRPGTGGPAKRPGHQGSRGAGGPEVGTTPLSPRG